MKFTTTAVLLGAAIGATARPSGHAHSHAHRSIEARGNFVMNMKPVPAPVVPETTTAAPAPTKAAPAPKPKKEKKPKQPEQPQQSSAPSQPKPSPSPSKGSGKAKPFCGGQSYTKVYDNKKRASIADIFSKGNIGTASDYGCNMMMVDEDVAEDYDHLTTFTNKASKTMECACFNKIGPTNNEVNGFFNGKEALKFTIGAGEQKYLAIDDNSQGGCSCGVGEVALTSFGEFADTWLEFDMKSAKNDDWSGADASCLVAAAEGMDILGMKVCGHDECSTINPGGTGTNAYLGGMEAEDGVGLNIAPGKVRLNVEIGYSGGN
ncbi:allergen Asp F4-like protein [Sarocladium implicatum]|nr:allergen Asp F4-like protein [Sarocladium implicatum]